MPCCALAAMVVGQLMILCGAIRTRWRGISGAQRRPAVAAGNPAAWRPGLPAPTFSAATAFRRPRLLAAACAADLVLLAAGGWGAAAVIGHHTGAEYPNMSVCGRLLDFTR